MPFVEPGDHRVRSGEGAGGGGKLGGRQQLVTSWGPEKPTVVRGAKVREL